MNSHQLQVCFVIPTYNESLNITRLLQCVTALHPDAHTAFLIVDDNSPDGTAKLVQEFAVGNPRVHLLEGQRRGLGGAYVRGMTHAINALGAEIIVQMDADFSHDPTDARKLLAHIKAGADVAIGSRYVTGGAIDERWAVARRLLSRWGNHLARWIAGLAKVRDCTAGFRAIKVSALRAAKVEKIRVQGHAFQIVLLHRLLLSGAHVVEEPVYFRDREHGQTKLGAKDLFEFFYNVWWLRLTSHWTFIKFGLVGLSGVLINLGSFQILFEMGAHKFVASPIAIQLSIVWNFFIHNYWTFADRVMPGRKRIRGLKYNLVSLITLTLSYATFIGLSVLFVETPPVLLQCFSIIPAMFINYFLNSYWIFSAQPNSSD